jgi:PAS domain S-box-containing protein
VAVRHTTLAREDEVLVLAVLREEFDVERALLESEQTLQAIVDSTTAVIYIKDIAGRYVLINHRFEQIFHLDSETAFGKSDHELFPADAAQRFRANDIQVQRVGEPLEFEERVPQDDGEHTYISIKFPLKRATGEIYAVCGISTDITARKLAEDELATTKRHLERLVAERTADLVDANRKLQKEVVEHQEVADQLRRLLETANEGIWTIDADGRTTFANQRMAEMLGYIPEEMIGRPMFDFMDADGRVEAERNLERRMQGVAEQHDFRFRRRDGSTLWTLLATGPIRDGAGRIVGALAMATDISARKESERRQAILLRELDHRVKNSLATVGALAQLTMSESSSLAEYQRSFSNRIQAMARTHEALARTHWSELEFGEIVEIVLAPERSRHEARIEICGGPVRIPATMTTPLALTLNELSTNALKYGALSSPEGELSLSWQRSDQNRFDMTWVERGGPGISMPADQGTGLPLIRGLIEYELNGTLDLEFASDGLVCRLSVPLPGQHERHEDRAAPSGHDTRDERG